MSVDPTQGTHDFPVEATHRVNADLDTIIDLLVEDVEEVTALRKDKRREDAPPTDEEFAFQLFADELKSLLSVLQDQQLARSVAAAVDTDHILIEELAQNDNRILEDRLLATRIERGEIISQACPPSPLAAEPTPAESRVDMGEFQATPKDLIGHAGGSQEIIKSAGRDVPSRVDSVWPSRTPSNTSSNVPSRSGSPGLSSKRNIECAICITSAKNSDLMFPCKHVYHVACAVQLFELAIKDESLMPPRCCRLPIPSEIVIPYLSDSSRTLFLQKSLEHETPDRLYCPITACSQFIGPASKERRDETCPKCSTVVCAACKAIAHPLHVPCRTDSDAQQVLALAEAEGWKRCPGCSHLVELSHGCYHMTCRCRAEFCYLCTARWKTCACQQWDETRLMTAAQHQVNVQLADNPPVARLEQQRLVREAAERLRVDHECNHRWRRRSGAAQCESCYHYLPLYIMRCNTCRMLACVRCVRNRL